MSEIDWSKLRESPEACQGLTSCWNWLSRCCRLTFSTSNREPSLISYREKPCSSPKLLISGYCGWWAGPQESWCLAPFPGCRLIVPLLQWDLHIPVPMGLKAFPTPQISRPQALLIAS